jgi:hypothetical protein
MKTKGIHTVFNSKRNRWGNKRAKCEGTLFTLNQRQCGSQGSQNRKKGKSGAHHSLSSWTNPKTQ